MVEVDDLDDALDRDAERCCDLRAPLPDPVGPVGDERDLTRGGGAPR